MLENSPTDSRPIANTHRSRVSNGSKLLVNIDGRTGWARRCRDVIEAHVSDLGGVDNTSEAQRSIVRRCAALTCELERMESGFAEAGEATDFQLELYQRTAGSLRRLLEAIGIERRSRLVGPTFSEVLRADRGAHD